MAWDPARGVFVLYGGRDRNWELLSTTWEWFPNSHAWRLVADAARQNPGPRMSHAMVWDAARERMILFGGTDLDRSFDDTWAFDGSASRWVRLDTTGDPPPRSQHGMVHDPATDQVIVFGGRGTNSQPYQDTWLLNLDTLEWIQHAPTEGAPHPRARDHVQMVRDSLSDIIVMCGRSLGDELAGETWQFDAHARRWRMVTTDQEPPAMDHGFLCSVERLGGLALFGFGGDEPQTWVYRPQAETWTLLEGKGEQPDFPMDHGQAASDGQHLFVLGGFGGENVPQDAGLTPRGAMWRF
ncbi:MAG: kelch repeat-containing protein [Planctomycetota bacterium]